MMKWNLLKFIDDRIEHYYKDSGYVELEFQKKAIRDAVKMYIYSFFGRSAVERMRFGILGNFQVKRLATTGDMPYVEDTEYDLKTHDFIASFLGEAFRDFDVTDVSTNPTEQELNDLNGYARKQESQGMVAILDKIYFDVSYYPMPVIYLDVGMGKTIAGVISACIIIETMLELNKIIEAEAKKVSIIPYANQSNEFLNATLKDFQINIAIIPAMQREFEKMIWKLFIKDGMDANEHKMSDFVNIKFIPNNKLTIFAKDNLDPNNFHSRFYHELFDKIGLCAIQYYYDKFVQFKGEEEGKLFIENTVLQGISMNPDEVNELEDKYEAGKITLEEAKANFWKRTQELTKEYAGNFGLPFFIVDEFASPKTFVYNNSSKMFDIFNVLDEERKGKYLAVTGVWLTASDNKAIDPINWMVSKISHFYDSFTSKQDVIKELIDKKVYKEAGFLYQNVYMNNDNINLYHNKLKEVEDMNIHLQKLIQQKHQNVSTLKKWFDAAVNNFLQTEEEMLAKNEFDNGANIQNLAKNLEELKIPLSAICADTSIKDFLDKKAQFEKDVEDFKQKTFYCYDIKDIMEDKGLGDLFEQKTIFLFDGEYKKHFKNKVTDFIKYLKDSDIDVLTVDTYSRDKLDAIIEKKKKAIKEENPEIADNEIKVGNIAIVGYVDEMGKGFNLQDFDSLLMMYAHQCSFDDIFQSLGRLDRIGTDLNAQKQAIFVHFFKDEDFFDKILKNRTKLAVEVKFEQYILSKSIPMDFINEVSKEVNKSLEELDNSILANKLDQSVATYKRIQKEAKEKSEISEENLQLYLENREIVIEMIKQMNELFDEQISALGCLVGGDIAFSGKQVGGTKLLEAIDNINSVINVA